MSEMELKELNKIWQEILNSIELEVSKPTFKTWFVNTNIVERKGEKIIIGVPSNFVKEWLKKKFLNLITKHIKKFFQDVKTIDFVVVNKPIISISHIYKKEIQSSSKLEIFQIDPKTNLNKKYRFSNFVVGSNNELAFAAAEGIVKNPGEKYNPLFVYGGVGLGKTHLLQAIGNEILEKNKNLNVKYLTCDRFISELVNYIKNQQIEEFKLKFKDLDILIIDDVHFLSQKDRAQTELFHIFNFLYDRGKQIVFSSDRPPVLINDIEERLRSRFEGGLVVDITPPDYETRLAILKMKLSEKGEYLPDEVLSLIAEKVQKNVRELEGVLNKVLIYASKKQQINKEILDKILKEYYQDTYKLVSPSRILNIVASFYEINQKYLLEPTRKKEYVKPRQILMYLLRELANLSYPAIGEKIGGRDHTTVMYACEKIKKDIQRNQDLAREVEILKEKILNG
jgi:chromosomal replication initiator protein